MFTHLSVRIVPIQFIAENIFRAMNRFIPLEGYRGLPDIYRGQHLRLARHPLLRLNLDRCAQWTGTDACQRLHSNRVYRVGVQIRDRGQLIVVHHLILPGGHRLIRIRRVIYLITLRRDKKQKKVGNRFKGEIKFENLPSLARSVSDHRARAQWPGLNLPRCGTRF